MDTPLTVGLPGLRAAVRELGSAVVCFSGGIDSTLVLAVAASELGNQAVGLTAVGPALSSTERQDSARVAQLIGARHELVPSQEMKRPGYVQNGPDRCFHCKTELYEIAEQKRREWGFAHILNGTNADDLGDYRPGLDAAQEAGVRSPLVELGFRKEDVRQAAKELGLDVWDKPAAACLSSRIPYGHQVTEERLGQVEGFEADLRREGFQELRVRWHQRIARIELGESEMERAFKERARILAAGKRHGFTYVTLDLGGYRTGSHNEVLPGRGLPVVQ